jgi:hypothetical protein
MPDALVTPITFNIENLILSVSRQDYGRCFSLAASRKNLSLGIGTYRPGAFVDAKDARLNGRPRQPVTRD